MDENRFSLDRISNVTIIIVLVVLFSIFLMFFDENLGYSSFTSVRAKIDTLEAECATLREQIQSDSMIVTGMQDSAKFEHYLREEFNYLGEGETMYLINESK